jgi:hypothetical protein
MLFADSLEVFVGSAWLHVFIAQYIRIYRGNRHVELLHLTAAESKKPSIDVEYLLYQRRRQTRQEDDSSGLGAMSVMTRIQFERYKNESEEFSVRAREKQVRTAPSERVGVRYGVTMCCLPMVRLNSGMNCCTPCRH